MSVRGPLGEIRVIECAAGLPASYAGFLLAGLGAEVVRIEPAATSRGAPGDHVLRRGKRSAVLEDGDARATECRRALCASADVLLADETAPEAEQAAGRIDCRVSPWGAGGHPQGLPADEALVAALTGAQAMQWSWAGSPVWLVTPLIGYMTGTLAALGVTAALLARERGTPGQRIEVSAVGGALALGSGTYVRGPGQHGSLLAGGDPRGVYPNYGVYRASDGWLFVGALTQAFWVKLVTLVERVDLLVDPRLQGHPFSFGAPDTKAFVRAALDPIFAARTHGRVARPATRGGHPLWPCPYARRGARRPRRAGARARDRARRPRPRTDVAAGGAGALLGHAGTAAASRVAARRGHGNGVRRGCTQ